MKKYLQLKWTKSPNSDALDRKYLDYIVSGQILSDYLGNSGHSSVTPLGYFHNKEQEKRALSEFRLKQKSILVDNRVELYICEECGDIGCGAITVKIIDKGDRIIWTQFADQNIPEEIDELYLVDDIEFDRKNYFKAFSSIK